MDDFIRKAIRDKLNGYKVINIRDVDYDAAKKEVLDYYAVHDEAYISNVAEDLELDLDLVDAVIDELIREGRLKDA